MADKRIRLVDVVKGAQRYPIRVPELDEHGEVIFEGEKCEKCGRERRAKLKPGGTKDILELLFTRIPREVLTAKDSARITRWFDYLFDAKDGFLQVPEGDYDWLFGNSEANEVGLLNRKVKQQGVEKDEWPTLGMTLFGIDEYTIREQLKPVPKEEVKAERRAAKAG